MVHCTFHFGPVGRAVLAGLLLADKGNAKKRRRIAPICLGMAALCLFACARFFAAGFAAGGVCTALLAAFFHAVLGGGAKWYQRALIRRALKSAATALYTGEREYIFTEEGVRIRSPLGDTLNHWCAFQSWGQSGRYLYLRRVDGPFVLVDGETLSPPARRELEGLLANLPRQQ